MEQATPVKNIRQKDIDKIVKWESTKLLLAGSVLVLLGGVEILLALSEGFYLIKAPSWVNLAGFIVVVLAMVLTYSRPIVQSLIRSSQDEYEYHVNIAAKAKAYDFFVPGAMAALFFSPGVGVNGLLAVVLGISLIITARGGGHLDA